MDNAVIGIGLYLGFVAFVVVLLIALIAFDR